MDILKVLRDWYGVSTNKALALNLFKDIVFYSLFFYVAFNANQFCVKQGLPTFKEYLNLTNHSIFVNTSALNLTK
jgi:hypothetical protein